MRVSFYKVASVLCFIAIIISPVAAIGTKMTKNKIDLPKTIDSWIKPDKAEIIDSENIFNYMNGGGELYLAYGFDHLEVYEYKSDQQDSILVEIYYMKTSNDAFGLLSLDWGGEPALVHSAASSSTGSTVSPSIRALYGKGLLRIWADTIYARVMAYRETTESKEAVLSLGKVIGSDQKMPDEPELLKVFPETIKPDWKLKKDRIAYFRSHLVLNSQYYLSHQNILLLDHSAEAVIAPYVNLSNTGAKKSVQVLFVRYADDQRARKALSQFHSTYLNDQNKKNDPNVGIESKRFFKIEDGWLGYLRDGRHLTIAFECPDRSFAQLILKQMFKKESRHGR